MAELDVDTNDKCDLQIMDFWLLASEVQFASERRESISSSLSLQQTSLMTQ